MNYRSKLLVAASFLAASCSHSSPPETMEMSPEDKMGDKTQEREPLLDGSSVSNNSPPPTPKTKLENKNLGFANLGNTCWMNATHKLLAQHSGLFAALKQPVIQASTEQERQGIKEVRHSLLLLFKQYATAFIGVPINVFDLNHKQAIENYLNRLKDYLEATGRVRYAGIGEEQFDASDYLQEVIFRDLKLEASIGNQITEAELITQDNGERRVNPPLDELTPIFLLNVQGFESFQAALNYHFQGEQRSDENKRPFKVQNRLFAYLQSSQKSLKKSLKNLPQYFFIQVIRHNSEGKSLSSNIEADKLITGSKLRVYSKEFPLQEDYYQELSLHLLGAVIRDGVNQHHGHYFAYTIGKSNHGWLRHDDTQVESFSSGKKLSIFHRDLVQKSVLLLFKLKKNE